MSQRILLAFLRFALSLRYKIVLKNPIPELKGGAVLFLPNHMALMDPVILTALLYPKYKIRALADESQIDLPFLKKLIQGFRPIAIPDLAKSGDKKNQVLEGMNEVVKALKQKDNILLYPAGHLYRRNREDLGSNSSVEMILKNVPEVQIVLIRFSGLWGSQFSWASGLKPKIYTDIWKQPLRLLANALFFMPKREVTLEFSPLPSDFPHEGTRLEMNRSLERFYNAEEAHNTFIPHYWWQGSKPELRPEVVQKEIALDLSDVPQETVEEILTKLKEQTGVEKMTLSSNLSQDLGMDSLSLAEFLSWISEKYGMSVESIEGITSVGDLVLIACGQSTKKEIEKKTAPLKWFSPALKKNLHCPYDKTLPQIFLELTKADPNYVLAADETSGVKTRRELLVAMKLLSSEIAKTEEERVGIMLPASVACTTLFLSTHFAQKIPVMVNWTVGSSVLKDSLDSVGIKTILTSKKMVEKLKTTGFDCSTLPYRWIFLEDVAKTFTLPQKLLALLSTYLPWQPLKAPTDPQKTAVILFTSGSEAKPKAVPLSHENIQYDSHYALKLAQLPGNTSLLAMLPPFHSMGLMIGIGLPLTSGMRAYYHPNPTESVILADLIERYKINLFVGTPTFANGVLRVASKEQLSTLRFAVMGAEKCPDYVSQKFQDHCPEARIVEGYGITECSPIVSINSLTTPLLGTLGIVLENIEHTIVHPESFEPLPAGEVGLLLVRGKNVFKGYLNTDASPFVQVQGKEWYNTGDLVKADPRGVLVFAGRLKRFVKLAGEMISLVALEDVLSQNFLPDDNGPIMAVEAAKADTQPELIFFSTKKVSRDEVNHLIRQSGLSGLYSIKRVVELPAIPLLGTGKTDYKALRVLANQG